MQQGNYDDDNLELLFLGGEKTNKRNKKSKKWIIALVIVAAVAVAVAAYFLLPRGTQGDAGADDGVFLNGISIYGVPPNP